MTSFINWDSRRTLGIYSIDQEHKQIALLLNDLYYLLTCGDKIMCSRLTGMLNMLLEISREHFLNEENIMEQVHYPGLRMHKQEHYLLLVELKDFIRQFNSGQLYLTTRTLNDLKNWFLAHIHSSDKKFSIYYHKQDFNGLVAQRCVRKINSKI